MEAEIEHSPITNRFHFSFFPILSAWFAHFKLVCKAHCGASSLTNLQKQCDPKCRVNLKFLVLRVSCCEYVFHVKICVISSHIKIHMIIHGEILWSIHLNWKYNRKKLIIFTAEWKERIVARSPTTDWFF